MKILLKFDGRQQMFHYYWLPLIYKHSECAFFVEDKSGKLITPNGIKNLKVISDFKSLNVNDAKLCYIDEIPTYKTMANFNHNTFYKVYSTPKEIPIGKIEFVDKKGTIDCV